VRQEVLVVQTIGAPRPPRRRRRAREAEEGLPQELPVTRVTAVRADPFPGEAEASAWLEELADDHQALSDAAEEGLRLLNQALSAARAAAGDPYLQELGTRRALAIRVGYGSGEQVAEGEWLEARELEPGAPAPGRGGRRARREAALAPQERIAAVLTGREQLDACETMLARARVDLDAGRNREAALQLRVGLEALLVELRDAMQDPGHTEDMEVLGQRRGEAGDAANAALRGELDDGQVESVRELLALAERVLRRRRVLHG
jgi:hypothetical protein